MSNYVVFCFYKLASYYLYHGHCTHVCFFYTVHLHLSLLHSLTHFYASLSDILLNTQITKHFFQYFVLRCNARTPN
jgi:hypothetical protein